jgi:hypothetical protein
MARKPNKSNVICRECGRHMGKNGTSFGRQKYICRHHKPAITLVEGGRKPGGQPKYGHRGMTDHERTTFHRTKKLPDDFYPQKQTANCG